jgi:hypothetical protein
MQKQKISSRIGVSLVSLANIMLSFECLFSAHPHLPPETRGQQPSPPRHGEGPITTTNRTSSATEGPTLSSGPPTNQRKRKRSRAAFAVRAASLLPELAASHERLHISLIRRRRDRTRSSTVPTETTAPLPRTARCDRSRVSAARRTGVSSRPENDARGHLLIAGARASRVRPGPIHSTRRRTPSGCRDTATEGRPQIASSCAPHNRHSACDHSA